MHAACTPQAHYCTQRARALPNTASRSPRGVRQSTPRRRLLPPCTPPDKPRLAQRTAGAAAAMPRQEPPPPPSPPAGTMASSSTTTTRSSSASAAPGACLRSSSGTARWACLWRCEPPALPCIRTHFGWLASASWHRHRHCPRICACVRACDNTVAAPLSDLLFLTLVDFLLAAAKVGHVRVDQHFHQEQPRRPQVSLRRAIVTSCPVHVSMLHVRHAPYFRSAEAAWVSVHCGFLSPLARAR